MREKNFTVIKSDLNGRFKLCCYDPLLLSIKPACGQGAEARPALAALFSCTSPATNGDRDFIKAVAGKNHTINPTFAGK
jgi:hypothetical protein